MGGGVESGDPKKGSVEVNVIPMIDMLIMLLIFQLTNFATSVFEDVTSIVAKMPVFGPANPNQEPPPDEDPNKIKSLEVRMTKETGFVVMVTTVGAGASQIDVPLGDGGIFQFEKLTEELAKIKQAHESHEDILLRIEKGIIYADVINAMDAVREQLARGDTGQVMRFKMFPSVSLTDSGS